MKFTKLVRNNNIPWPTQRKFSREKWIEMGEKLIEDALDKQVYDVGIWADTSMSDIRMRITDSSIWNLPIKQLARYLLALANSDTKIIMDKYDEVSSTHPVRLSVSDDEVVYQALGEDLWGSKKSSSILDTVIDSVDLCLKYSGENVKQKEKGSLIDSSELKKMLNFAGIYRALEEVFYDALWFESSLQERDNCWELLPKDMGKEAILAASLKRHEELLVQIFASAGELWRKNRMLAKSAIGITKLASVYHLQTKMVSSL